MPQPYPDAFQDDLIDRIHEASVIPDHWPDVLERLARFAESREAVVVALKTDGYRAIGSSGLAETFVEDNYRFESGMERSRRLLAEERPTFITDYDVFSEEELATLPVFAEYLRPMGYGKGVATVVRPPDGQVIIIHAEGDYRMGRYDEAVVQRLNGLRPHLARAALVSARLAFERARTAVETLAGLGYSACAVTSEGKVIVTNAAFDADGRTWTTRAGDRLVLHDLRAGRLLEAALSTIDVHNGVRSIALAATATTEPAVLQIIPVRRAALDIFSRSAAILVLTTAAKDPTRQTGLLQALFDLTPVEASIAARVAAGQTTEQIAANDTKSPETVRSQLKNVLSKTGCGKQVDLTRLLTSLVPPRLSRGQPGS